MVLAGLAVAFTIYFMATTASLNVSYTIASQVLQLPLPLIVLKFFALGVVTMFCVWKIRSKELKSEAKQLQWQAQDAKLAVEIQSDKEKQLEAKIATLEAALTSALKKKS
jgi:uncharacterized integral membrane protein